MVDTRKMSDLHEKFLAEVFGGRRTRGSGNQWRDQMDGKHNRMIEPFAFAWDGKATLAKSITITLDMIKKAREQSGGDEPMLALRWYANENLDVLEDWVLISPHTLAELREENARLRAQLIDAETIIKSGRQEPELPGDYRKIEAVRQENGAYQVFVNGEETDIPVQIMDGADRLSYIRLGKSKIPNGEVWVNGTLRARVLEGKAQPVVAP